MKNLLDWAAVADQVQVVQEPDASHFDEGVPFVIKGGQKIETPAGWTPEGLKERIGSRVVRGVFVALNGCFLGGRPPYDPAKQRVVEMPFDEFIDRCTGEGGHEPIIGPGERYYLYQQQFAALDILGKDIRRPEVGPIKEVDASGVRSHFWIGGAGNITQTHFDMEDNFLVHLQGTKRALLWHPNQFKNLYIRPMGEVHHLHSRVDPFEHRPDEFPNFEDARALSCTLTPGDVLFIPTCWMHYVYTVEFSVSANFWWSVPDITRLFQLFSGLKRGEVTFEELRDKGIRALQSRPYHRDLFVSMLKEVDFAKLMTTEFRVVNRQLEG